MQFRTIDLLSQRSSMFSKDSQPAETTESLENSLDSDMFSISDCSNDIEVPYSQETMYPMLNNILHQLLTGFRAATQYQSSFGEIGETLVLSLAQPSLLIPKTRQDPAVRENRNKTRKMALTKTTPFRPFRRKWNRVKARSLRNRLPAPTWSGTRSNTAVAASRRLANFSLRQTTSPWETYSWTLLSDLPGNRFPRWRQLRKAYQSWNMHSPRSHYVRWYLISTAVSDAPKIQAKC